MPAAERIAFAPALASFFCMVRRARAHALAASFLPISGCIRFFSSRFAMALSLVNQLLRAARWSIYLKRRVIPLVSASAGIAQCSLWRCSHWLRFRATCTPFGVAAFIDTVRCVRHARCYSLDTSFSLLIGPIAWLVEGVGF
jgi:hypothetical protein